MKRLLFIFLFLLLKVPSSAQDDLALASLKEPHFVKPSRMFTTPGVAGDVKVRPFITDDARVVGNRLAQMESWMRIDRESGQQWFLFAYGPKNWLELTVGGVVGYAKDKEHNRSLSYALPLVQAKFLIRPYKPNRAPGLGAVIGTFLPTGRGLFVPPGYGTFGFLIVTQSLGEGDKVLIHGNVGGNYLHVDGSGEFINTWGLGTQIKIIGGMHFVGEVFSGDPYIPGTGTAYQVGYRHFFSDLFQIDMTVGNGIGGINPMPFWFSAGVRLVTERFLCSRKR